MAQTTPDNADDGVGPMFGLQRDNRHDKGRNQRKPDRPQQERPPEEYGQADAAVSRVGNAAG